MHCLHEAYAGPYWTYAAQGTLQQMQHGIDADGTLHKADHVSDRLVEAEPVLAC